MMKNESLSDKIIIFPPDELAPLLRIIHHFLYVVETFVVNVEIVKILLCWCDFLKIYVRIDFDTFLDDFISHGGSSELR